MDILIPSDYQEHVGHACNAADNTQMAFQLVSSGATKDNPGEITLCSLNSGENQSEQSTPCEGKPSSHDMASPGKKTKQKNPDTDASYSQPSKKLKEGNAPETTPLTSCQINTKSIQTPSKENLSGFPSPAMGVASDCSKQSMFGDQPSVNTQSCSQGKEVQKIDESDHHTMGVVKRKGRQPKLQVKSAQPSIGGKKGNAGVDTAEAFDEKECVTKEIDITVSQQAKNPHQLPSQESLKSISDQKDQLNDPATQKIKEINQLKGGENSQKKRRGRPPKLLQESPDTSVADKKQNGHAVAADGIVLKNCMRNDVELPTITVAGSKKLPISPRKCKNVLSSMPLAEEDILLNEKVVQASSKKLEKPSSKGGGQSVNLNIELPIQDSQDASRGKREEGFETDSMIKEVGMVIDEVPSNVSDNQPLSTWFEGMHTLTTVNGSRVSPNWTTPQYKETNERQIEIAMQTAAVDGCGGIVPDLNQSLSFVKTCPLWEMIESMVVFKMLPQKPHFRPLDSCKESSREGIAIGCMVTFSGVAKKTSELQFDDPRSSIEDSLETLLELEGHGFDVQMVRDRLTSMLLIKDRQELLQDQLKEPVSQIMEHNHERTKIDEEIDELDKQIRELQEKRAVAMSMREIKDSEIASLQSRVNSINEGIKSIQLDFEELAAAPWQVV